MQMFVASDCLHCFAQCLKFRLSCCTIMSLDFLFCKRMDFLFHLKVQLVLSIFVCSDFLYTVVELEPC